MKYINNVLPITFILIFYLYLFLDILSETKNSSDALSIKEKLMKCQDGQMVLEYYSSVGHFNESMRNKLCSVII